MNEQQLFSAWVKTKQTTNRVNNSAVIYTRFSSKAQAMTNLSVQFQKQSLSMHRNNNFRILVEFGGTYESADMDGRREFIGCSSSLKPTIVWLSTPSNAGWLKKIAEKI